MPVVVRRLEGYTAHSISRVRIVPFPTNFKSDGINARAQQPHHISPGKKAIYCSFVHW